MRAKQGVFTVVLLVCTCCVAVSCLPGPCRAQEGLSVEEQIELIDSELSHLQFLLDKHSTGEYWLLPHVGFGAYWMAPTPKDDIACTVAGLVMLGTIKPEDVPGLLAKLESLSDQNAETMRQRRNELREERQRLARGEPATPPATTGPQLGRGHWQLRDGYPAITNSNPNNNAIETVESDVSTSSISYRYTKRKYSGEVEHEFTLSANFSGLDKAVREGNEEFTFVLEASCTRGKDFELFDGKCPYLERDGVTVVSVDPMPADKRLEDAAQLWVGRFTDGKDFPSDQRSITVRMPKGGTECSYGVSIDPNHKVIWAYKWIE